MHKKLLKTYFSFSEINDPIYHEPIRNLLFCNLSAEVFTCVDLEIGSEVTKREIWPCYLLYRTLRTTILCSANYLRTHSVNYKKITEQG